MPTCQDITCFEIEDVEIFNLQPLPPVPLPQRQVFRNEAVYFVCVGTLSFTGTPPPWITVDTSNNRLVGAAGLYIGTTQANANANAQSVLDTYAASKIASGQFECQIGTLRMEATYLDFTDGSTFAFGNVPVGATGSNAEFVYSNVGEGALQIASIELTGSTAFTMESLFPSDPPLTLQPFETYTIRVTASKLTPASGEAGVLTVVHNGTNTPFVTNLSANFT